MSGTSALHGLPAPDHQTHRSGLEVAVRPPRKDWHEDAVRWWDAQYDRVGTEKLIELFRIFAHVELVLFNDNHFHVKIQG